MGASREQRVREVYGCFDERWLHRLDSVLPADAELVQDPAFPGARTWRGLQGVKAWFGQISADFGTVSVELVELAQQGECALATVEISAQGRSSGAPVRHRMAHLWTFRGDEPVRCRFFLDVEQAQREFGRQAGQART